MPSLKESKTSKSDETVVQSPGRPFSISGLPRSAIIIGLVSLFADISTEMIYPLVPIFLVETLEAPKSAVGLIEGVAVGTALIVTSLSGIISDRIGRRKPVAFTGYALTALSRPLMAVAVSWPVVMGARFTDRFGKGIRSAPKDALLADTVSAESRGRAYGFERAMDYSGAVIGPLVGLLLLGWMGDERVRTIFLISAIPAAIAALLILAIREEKKESGTESKTIRLSLAGTTREYKRLLVVAGVFGLANSANAFVILRAQDLFSFGFIAGGLSAGEARSVAVFWSVLAYVFYNAVASLFSMPAGAASDRVGRRNLLVIGYSVYAASYAGFGLANAAWMVWPLFALYGLFPAFTDGIAKAMAVDTAGKAGRATAIGIYSAVAGVTQIAASYIGGLLWDNVSAQATFYTGAALATLAVFLLLALFPSRIESKTA